MPKDNDLKFDQVSIQADYWKKQEQYRDFQSEKYFVESKIYAEQHHLECKKNLDGIITYGMNSVSMLVLFNGGAILSLITFIDSLFSKGDERNVLIVSSFAHSFVPAFYWFVCGLMLAAVTSGVAYLNFLHGAELWNGPAQNFKFIHSEKVLETPTINQKVTFLTAWIAVISATISLVSFVLGSCFVATGFVVLGVR